MCVSVSAEIIRIRNDLLWKKNLVIISIVIIYFGIVDQLKLELIVNRRRSTRTFKCVYRLEMTKKKKRTEEAKSMR